MHRRTALKSILASLGMGTGLIGAWLARNDDAVSERAAIQILDTARRMADLPRLTSQASLRQMAHRQIHVMSRLGRTTHHGVDGQDPNLRARQAGFSGRILGEALAETHDTPEQTMAFWLSHPPTREVLMDAEARQFGVAALQGQDGRIWWTLVTAA